MAVAFAELIFYQANVGCLEEMHFYSIFSNIELSLPSI